MLGDREVIHQLQALVAKLPFIILGAVCRFLTRITVILIVNWTGCLLAWSQITAQGAFQKNIAIALPNYYHVEPNLHLIYNSLAGNGWLGEGWSLVGSSEIFRASAGRGAPNYDATDRFFLDGVELLPCEGAAAGSKLRRQPVMQIQRNAAAAGLCCADREFRTNRFRSHGGWWWSLVRLGEKWNQANVRSASSIWLCEVGAVQLASCERSGHDRAHGVIFLPTSS